MAAKGSSEEAQPLLTPDVINPPPLTPPAAERYRDDVIGGDDYKPGTEFRITPAIVVRVIISALAFSNIVVQLVGKPVIFASVMLVILAFLCLFWNMLASTPSKIMKCFRLGGRGKERLLPELGLFVGGSEVGDRKKKYIGASLIDFLLGLLLLLFTVDAITNPGWRAPYNRHSAAVLAISFILMALQFFISIFQQFSWFQVIHLTIHASIPRNDDDYRYRIQLPQDIEEGSSRKNTVSIVA